MANNPKVLKEASSIKVLTYNFRPTGEKATFTYDKIKEENRLDQLLNLLETMYPEVDQIEAEELNKLLSENSKWLFDMLDIKENNNEEYSMKMKFKLKEDINPYTKKALLAYKKYSGIDKGRKLKDIDEWALNEAACEFNQRPEILREAILDEDVTLQLAADDLNAKETALGSGNQITKVLDRSLKKALKMRGAEEDFPNVLLIGSAGSSKTSVVRQWAKDNNINLVQKNLGTMGPEAFAGIIARDADDPRFATRLGTNELIKDLSKPRSVLFLDEYNRAKTEIRGAVLTLVLNHMVWDPTQESGEKHLDNFLFTIAAINPSGSVYKGAKELDPAELSRFYSLSILMTPEEHLDYLRKFYKEAINKEEDEEEKWALEGRLALAEKILNTPSFTYDSELEIEDNFEDRKYRPLNYRSFKLALDFSDGTKEDFLEVWNHYCNYNKKGIIETALRDYIDIKDKANLALERDTESEVFGKRKSNLDLLRDKYKDLNI